MDFLGPLYTKIARNQEFGLSTLHTKGQSQGLALQNAYMATLFDQGDGLLKEVWVGQEWKPKLWSRGRQFFFIKNQNYILLPIFNPFL